MHRVEHVDVLMPSLRGCVKAGSLFFFLLSHIFAEAQKDAAKHVSSLKINVLCNVAVLFKYQVTILNMDW
jgi:hypothetical protein